MILILVTVTGPTSSDAGTTVNTNVNTGTVAGGSLEMMVLQLLLPIVEQLVHVVANTNNGSSDTTSLVLVLLKPLVVTWNNKYPETATDGNNHQI